jgi:hypothetical protein
MIDACGFSIPGSFIYFPYDNNDSNVISFIDVMVSAYMFFPMITIASGGVLKSMTISTVSTSLSAAMFYGRCF